jgi:CheY-like chemotaxis protein
MPKTLLLADDSVTIQKVVGISFANEDVVLLTVDNGDDAVLRARESRPDIVLADVVMPGKNGYEVCEAIKSDPDLAATPVLLLTGTFEAFDEDRAQRARADGHITKPFEAQALVDEVNSLLARTGGAASPISSNAAPVEAPVSASADTAFDFFDDEMDPPTDSESASAVARDTSDATSDAILLGRDPETPAFGFGEADESDRTPADRSGAGVVREEPTRLEGVTLDEGATLALLDDAPTAPPALEGEDAMGGEPLVADLDVAADAGDLGGDTDGGALAFDLEGDSDDGAPVLDLRGDSDPGAPVLDLGGDSDPGSPVLDLRGDSDPGAPVLDLGGDSDPGSPVLDLGGDSDPGSPVLDLGGDSDGEPPALDFDALDDVPSRPRDPQAQSAAQLFDDPPAAEVEPAPMAAPDAGSSDSDTRVLMGPGGADDDPLLDLATFVDPTEGAGAELAVEADEAIGEAILDPAAGRGDYDVSSSDLGSPLTSQPESGLEASVHPAAGEIFVPITAEPAPPETPSGDGAAEIEASAWESPPEAAGSSWSESPPERAASSWSESPEPAGNRWAETGPENPWASPSEDAWRPAGADTSQEPAETDAEPSTDRREATGLGVESSAAAARKLSPELRDELRDAIEKIAWEAFGQLTEQLVKDAVTRVEQVAWEVVPQMTEALLEEEIRKLKGE